MFIVVTGSGCRGLESGEDQVSMDVRNVIQDSESDLMAKQVGPHYEATEYEDLSGEKNLALDGVVGD